MLSLGGAPASRLTLLEGEQQEEGLPASCLRIHKSTPETDGEGVCRSTQVYILKSFIQGCLLSTHCESVSNPLPEFAV